MPRQPVPRDTGDSIGLGQRPKPDPTRVDAVFGKGTVVGGTPLPHLPEQEPEWD